MLLKLLMFIFFLFVEGKNYVEYNTIHNKVFNEFIFYLFKIQNKRKQQQWR